MFRRSLILTAALLLCVHPRLSAQDTTRLEFDGVSIKTNTQPVGSGSTIRILPGGTLTAVNEPIWFLLSFVSGILPDNIVGLPNWAKTEGYDITAKPPAGTTAEQLRSMWQSALADRMKLVLHVEQREATVFALVMARSDGRLGPALKKSNLECGTPQDPSTPGPSGPADSAQRCGMMFYGSSIVSGGITMDNLAQNLSGRAGGPVTNRTGLEGYYALTLTYAPQGRGATATDSSDAADFFTALQEQLGLKLQSEKGTIPYLVIDHIERPTPD